MATRVRIGATVISFDRGRSSVRRGLAIAANLPIE
jgi:hypothetical protein